MTERHSFSMLRHSSAYVVYVYKHIFEYIIIGSPMFAIVVGLQCISGAYTAEFFNDEASHYISGLFLFEYIRHILVYLPVQYLKFFHSHYPMIGIGHWPPLYYLLEAAWMLIFFPSRMSMLLLSAFVSAATALLCYAFATRPLGRPSAVFVALAFVLSPMTQGASAELMLDVPVAFFCIGAAAAYAPYLASGNLRYSVAFALLASAAILTKGNGLLLVLLPPIAILIGRRFDLLRKWSFWSPIPIVAVLTAPWYVATYGMVAQGFRYSWGSAYFYAAVKANALAILSAVGPLVLVCTAIGLATVIIRPRSGQRDSWLICTAALFAATWVFQSVVPAAIQDRYLEPALPPLLILAAFGGCRVLFWLAKHAPALQSHLSSSGRISTVSALALAISLLPRAVDYEVRAPRGYIDAAHAVWANYVEANPSVLIATDAAGEGAAIVELATDDPHRPSLFAIRGSRLLGGGGYNNQDYRPRFSNPEQVMAAIDEYAIPLVLVSTAGDHYAWTHLRQLEQARELYPDRWDLIYQGFRGSSGVQLFRIRGNREKSADIPKLLALSAPLTLK